MASHFPQQTLREIAGRIRTIPPGPLVLPTVALIVFNTGETEVTQTTAAFCAAFPVRAEIEPPPVLVRAARGEIVSSRLTQSELGARQSDGRRLWTLELRWNVVELSAGCWRTFFACYEPSPDAPAPELFSLPDSSLCVIETDCHDGDLPLAGRLSDAVV